ncbi:hypothetical protein OE88DRAFT_1650518 [Heliocybe sulcata]|uniref:Dystroglycan-type cadherin-like domain-containing protein n=1 Tax=Heliocybe sulcata TaxID=5364 RepID=A0A5C3NHW2_9AGAM|nr:hypothetical protein OE88DRAFT_1650518 [Heliocybe sulcata]
MPVRPVVPLVVSFFPAFAQAFSFSFGTPTQCDDLSLSWTGGTAPFELTLIPVFGTPRNISIPSSAFSNGRGSYKTQVPFTSNHKLVIAMSDATGFGSGGVSDLVNVGQSVGNVNCNTTDPGVDFDYQLNTALQQCRPYTFSEYTGAVQPITIAGIIPGGNVFYVQPPSGPTSFDWTADVAAGTSVIWAVTDARGRQGGTSDVQSVGITNDASCLLANAPSSTSNPPSATSSIASTSTLNTGSGSSSTAPAASATTSPSSDPTNSVSTAAIAGTVIGGLVAVAAVVTLLLFCLKNRRSRWPYAHRDSHRLDSVDLTQEPIAYQVSPYPYTPNTAHMPQSSAYSEADFMDAQGRGPVYPLPPLPSEPPPFDPYGTPQPQTPHTPGTSFGERPRRQSRQSAGSSAAGRRKAAMAGVTSYQAPSRFILHNDMEEIMPDENGVVELPPQYSEARKPIPGLSAQNSEQSSTASAPSASTAATPLEEPPSPPGLPPPHS